MEGKTWRLIESGRGSPQWNMAVDEALLYLHEEGRMPILRLYGWERSLSLGRFSSVAQTLHPERLEAASIPYVRRMSGGGVLLHGGDLCYALIMDRETVKRHGIRKSYRRLCRFLIRLYEKLGHRAAFAADEGYAETKSPLCAAGMEAYDIVIGGKKIGGNAQRHTSRALLQHGTIPIRLEAEPLRGVLSDEGRLGDAASLESLGTPTEEGELRALLIEAFCETYDAELLRSGLRSAEAARAEELLATKYRLKRWNDDGDHR